MKNLFLLFFILFFTFSSNAQSIQKSTAFSYNGVSSVNVEKPTLTGGGRWYSYAYFLSNLGWGIAQTKYYYPNIWNDTTAIFNNSDSSYSYNQLTSVGVILDPMYSGFNDNILYPGERCILPTDAYTIDSVHIYGKYFRNNNRTLPIDTLRLTYIYGDGIINLITKNNNDSGSHLNFPYPEYGIDSLTYLIMKHNSLLNCLDSQNGGPVPIIKNIYLSSTDTSANFDKSFPILHLVVPPGKVVGLSLSFISGDATYPFNDTVQYANGSFKRGVFLPQVIFKGTSDTSPVFPPFIFNDFNTGFFKQEGVNDSGWGGQYQPNWVITNAGHSASKLQYPVIDFHTTCAFCCLGDFTSNIKQPLTEIEAAPNPANNELTISYTLVQPSYIHIALKNIIGQIVATKDIEDTKTGQININITSLQNGLYFYTFQSNSFCTTGRVSVVH